MKGFKIPYTLFLTMVLMTSFSTPVFPYSREDLAKYKEAELMAPDFSLKALDGNTYKLSDFKGKKFVVIQTGSST